MESQLAMRDNMQERVQQWEMEVELISQVVCGKVVQSKILLKIKIFASMERWQSTATMHITLENSTWNKAIPGTYSKNGGLQRRSKPFT